MQDSIVRDAIAVEVQDWRSPFSGMRILKRSAEPIRHIQIFGQRCSGTNVLAKLVAANFGADAVTDRYGFKHWFVPLQTLIPPDVLVIVVARQATEWVRSLHRQPWHAHPDLKALPFSAFIRAPWHSYWDAEVGGVDRHHPVFNTEMLHERDPDTGLRFDNVLLKRTAKLRSWARTTDRAHNLCLLDQQVLVASPGGLIDALASVLERVPAGNFAPVETYKGNGFNAFVPRVYEPLSGEDESFIHSQLDRQVEAGFGFHVPPSPAEPRALPPVELDARGTF